MTAVGYLGDALAAALAAHEVDTTNVHGITDTALLASRLASAPATALPDLDYTGVVDATSAINAALVTGASVVTAAGTLKISAPGISIPAAVNFDSSQTQFVYTGTGTAITVASNSTDQSISIVRIGKVRRSVSNGWFTGADTTSVGVKLANCNWRFVEVLECLYFETGVLLEGNNAGTAYNSIYLGRIADNRRNVRCSNVGSGWTNANNFYGGTLRIDSGFAWNGTDGPTDPTSSVLLDLSTAGNGNNFFGVTLEGGNNWRTFRIGVDSNNLWNCRLEEARTGGCEFLAGSYGNYVYGGYGNFGPGSPIFTDAGANIIVGNRGMRMYSDSSGGSPANGGLAAYEAKGISGAADILFRSREFGGNLRWEQNARGQSRHYTGAGAYPILLIDPSTLAPLSGGGYSAGRGNVDPDVCIGRSPGNVAAWISSAPILTKTSSTTLAANGALTITASAADVHVVTLQANATSTTISTPANTTGWSQLITLELVQDATGGRTWVAPSNVVWVGGVTPALSTSANARDVFRLRYDSTLSSWVELGRAVKVDRVTTVTSGSTPTPNAGTTDVYEVTALAVPATFGAPTGSPNNRQSLLIAVKDDGTARALAWNAIYRAVGTVIPTTTVAGKQLYVGARYNTAAAKWDVLAVCTE